MALYHLLEGFFIKLKLFTPILLTAILILSACADGDNDNNDSASEQENLNTENDTENASQDEYVDGTIWGEEGDIGVILSHGAAYDADSWEKQGEKLADEGMVAFAVEDTDPEVLTDAANMLKEDQGAKEIAIIGASAGGSTAIEAVKEGDVDFNRVVLLSPGGDAASIENTPVLTIYSEEEGFEDLEEAAEADGNLETTSIPGSAHAQEFFQDEETAEQVMEDIIAFLKET